ncbi:MAG: DUF4153 domain-containing protein [Klebsiella michiganensis]|uniref:DUF4153 domain-containing protein n=1 Tax=Superficieibacter electus TaxID=2022662 RepID=A0A2P5GK64_9ENTR|nr:DUF4153 domain-containing protein [Superficieibacter electus]MDU4390562.1 DUF4153 domain-containing protein [Klebsiella michiganensis]POP43230.1 DUF4153 domain-containing protein [Superficieibacter electus]POP44783.1 DUF4153 domain-containing protein [Superficieibacter electus]
MDRIAPLSSTTRWGMIAAGLLQGLLCYVLLRVIEAHELPAVNGYMLYGVMGSIALSGTLLFTVTRFSQPALWAGLSIVLAVVCAMGWWVSWNFKHAESWQFQEALLLYSFLLVLMTMLMLPWFQARLQTGAFRAGYAFFYQRLWQNSLSLLLIFLATGLLWLVLTLWSELFKLLNLNFFHWLFFETKWFFYLSTGLVCALVLILARSESRLILAVQNLLALIARGLLPLVALVVLLFILTLPFVGIGTISTRISAAGLLNSLVLMLLILVAVVWSPEKNQLPYPLALRYLVRVSLFVLPLLALLAGWAMWVRIAQYGWTPERLYAVLITGVALVWACGYAFSILRHQPLSVQGAVNQGVALLMLTLLVLLHSPVLDRYRISVNSQMARYYSGQTSADNLSLSMLDGAGRRGHRALLALQNDRAFINDGARNRILKNMLNISRQNEVVVNVPFLQQNILLITRDRVPDKALWEQLISRRESVSGCLAAQKNCWLMAQDLNQDGVMEWLYYNLDERQITAFRQDKAGWATNGNAWDLPASLDKAALVQALEQGQVKLTPKVWQDLSINGERVKMNYYSEE